jgi:catechol 2,3-dioxygenase-like lactoylglutathione lyase family enzyme
MFSGAHVVVYTKDAEADRAFFRDVIGFDSVDAGGGWLIFALPPAEIAMHPAADNDRHEIYFMCQDLTETVGKLSTKGVECETAHDAGWGILTRFRLPGGGQIGLYQPRHPLAPRESQT